MRRPALSLGIALLGAIWLGPLLGAWRESFTAHMLAHMGVVAIAAPLIAIGISGTRLDFAGAHPLLLPMTVSILELFVVWGWHAPAMRALAEGSFAAAVLEQASFLAAGLALWVVCLGGRGSEAAGRRAAGVFGLLLTSVHMTLLGALVGLSPRPLYGVGDVTCFGLTLDAQQDQQLGGVIMLMVGGAIYLIGGLALLGRLLNEGSGKMAR